MATVKEVNASIFRIMKIVQETLTKKGDEYTGEDADRLGNFKVAAKIATTARGGVDMNPKRALWGYLLKHLTSIYYMCCMVKKKPSRADWDEKLVDAVSYILLLSAMVDEEIAEEFDNGEPRRHDSYSHPAAQKKNERQVANNKRNVISKLAGEIDAVAEAAKGE